ncbi:hypothetical protein Tco_1326966 [Tanacetum coccineum]
MVFITTPDSFPTITTLTCIDSTTSKSYSFIGLSSCHDTDEELRLQLLPFLPFTTTLHTTPHTRPRCTTTLAHISSYFITTIVVTLCPVNREESDSSIDQLRGLRADYGFVVTMDREIRHDPERYVGYGITDSWDEIVETLQGAPVSTDTELGAHVRDFESMVRRDTDEIYTMLDDEQSQRTVIGRPGQIMLFRDRRGHAHTRLLMETEARMSREAWVRSMDVSDLARAEVMSLRTTVHAHMSEITEL